MDRQPKNSPEQGGSIFTRNVSKVLRLLQRRTNQPAAEDRSERRNDLRHLIVNQEETASLQSRFANPEAVKRGAAPAQVVDRKEVVVNFAGKPDDFVALVQSVQERPLKPVDEEGRMLQTVSSRTPNLHVRKTGIQVVLPSSAPNGSTVTSIQNCEDRLHRVEVIGVSHKPGEGNWEGVTLLYVQRPQEIQVPLTNQEALSPNDRRSEFNLSTTSSPVNYLYDTPRLSGTGRDTYDKQLKGGATIYIASNSLKPGQVGPDHTVCIVPLAPKADQKISDLNGDSTIPLEIPDSLLKNLRFIVPAEMVSE